jgi:hypothetical protein
MLDLSVVVQKLTQGRPPAEMALAQAPATAAAPAAAAGPTMALSGPAEAAGAGGPAPVDAEALARRVYALAQQELRVESVRSGRSGGSDAVKPWA